jgi:hypothetical protein
VKKRLRNHLNQTGQNMGKDMHIKEYRSDSGKEHEKGIKRSNSKSNIPSDSIWSQDLEDALFPDKSKKNFKQKKKLREKLNKNQSTTEVKPEDKLFNEVKKQNSESKQTKNKKQKEVKETKDIEIEEKKIDLSVKPFLTPAQNTKSSSKVSKPKQLCEEAKQALQPKNVDNSCRKSVANKSSNQNFHRGKKFYTDELKHHNIPDETVSSFYQ